MFQIHFRSPIHDFMSDDEGDGHYSHAHMEYDFDTADDATVWARENLDLEHVSQTRPWIKDTATSEFIERL